MSTPIQIFPRATEKAYGLSKGNVYVFDVPTSANKQQILEAVESQFDVKTVNIKTLVQKGKGVRASRGKRAYPGTAFRKDMKKAYVTLIKGDSIKVFDEPEQTPDKKDGKK
jgi:ribosomal protein L23